MSKWYNVTNECVLCDSVRVTYVILHMVTGEVYDTHVGTFHVTRSDTHTWTTGGHITWPRWASLEQTQTSCHVGWIDVNMETICDSLIKAVPG